LGTRERRTFFSIGLAGIAVDEADATFTVALVASVVPGGAGGGFLSNVLMTDAGRASRACRYPVVKKSRCV
jgi:hypothetical protein